MVKLTDKDLMPFGKHKGLSMMEVPASYLDWLIDQDWIKDWPAVKNYIEDNKDVIDSELDKVAMESKHGDYGNRG